MIPASDHAWSSFAKKGIVMNRPKEERWRELCERVANEKDPVRFAQLIEELIRLLDELDEKDERTKGAAGALASYRQGPRPSPDGYETGTKDL